MTAICLSFEVAANRHRSINIDTDRQVDTYRWHRPMKNASVSSHVPSESGGNDKACLLSTKGDGRKMQNVLCSSDGRFALHPTAETRTHRSSLKK